MQTSLLSVLFFLSLFSLYLAVPVAVAVPETLTSALAIRAGGGAGEATFYEPGLGACGRVNTAADIIAAVAVGRGKGECFKKIRVSCGEKSVDVQIVDLCQSCVSLILPLARILGD